MGGSNWNWKVGKIGKIGRRVLDWRWGYEQAVVAGIIPKNHNWDVYNSISDILEGARFFRLEFVSYSFIETE